MIVELTPKIKFVCDRCGIEKYPDKNGNLLMPHNVEFREDTFMKRREKRGQICESCNSEFWEFANNFFDEVNKEGSNE